MWQMIMVLLIILIILIIFVFFTGNISVIIAFIGLFLFLSFIISYYLIMRRTYKKQKNISKYSK